MRPVWHKVAVSTSHSSALFPLHQPPSRYGTKELGRSRSPILSHTFQFHHTEQSVNAVILMEGNMQDVRDGYAPFKDDPSSPTMERLSVRTRLYVNHS